MFNKVLRCAVKIKKFNVLSWHATVLIDTVHDKYVLEFDLNISHLELSTHEDCHLIFSRINFTTHVHRKSATRRYDCKMSDMILRLCLMQVRIIDSGFCAFSP